LREKEDIDAREQPEAGEDDNAENGCSEEEGMDAGQEGEGVDVVQVDDGEGHIEGTDGGDEGTLSTEVECLRAEKGKIEREKREITDRYLRLQAEFANFRRRSQREKQELVSTANETLITELLPVLDNFERALQAFAGSTADQATESLTGGVEMIYRQFRDALEKAGLREIATEGQRFDPSVHEAVMMVPGDEENHNTVVEQLQKGYMLNDKVLRPSRVKVALNSGNNAEQKQGNDDENHTLD